MIDVYHNQLLAKTAQEKLQNLSQLLINELKPVSGTYSLFNLISQAMGRLKDCEYSIKRLYCGKNELNLLELDTNISEQEKYQKINEIDNFMQLDFESLYVFGTALLDQWSLICLHVDGVKKPEKDYQQPFYNLVAKYECGHNYRVINDIWINYKSLILWLNYQVRFYRNKFVIHSDRPWQRSISRSVIGDDFILFVPSPIGWLDDDKIRSEILDLIKFLPKSMQTLPENFDLIHPCHAVQPLFDKIDAIPNKKERDTVSNLYSKVGGKTPSFQIVAEKIFTFIILGTEILINISSKDYNSINIGRSKE